MDLDVVFLRLGRVWLTTLLPGCSVALSVGEVLVQGEISVLVSITLSKDLGELCLCPLLFSSVSFALCEFPGKAALIISPSLHLLDLLLYKRGECLLHMRCEVVWIKLFSDHVCVVDVGCSDIKGGCSVCCGIDALESFVEDLILCVSPGRQGLTSSLTSCPILPAEDQVLRKVEELVTICISLSE